jgi:hypothetical protein
MCDICGDDEAMASNYYGTMMCNDCIDAERNTDWDQYEADKRERIAEQQEY